MRGRLIPTLLLAATAVAAGGAAQAVNLDSYSKDGGAHAFSFGTNERAAVTDSKADGRTVHADYQRAGDVVRRLSNSSGSGTTVQTAAGATVRTLRGCTDYAVSPDDCGAWA